MKKSGVTVTVDKIAAVTRSIGQLVAHEVLVGIPQAKAPREGDPLNNATIGYIMETGSPAANIPARPWLVPGVQSAQEDVTDELGGAAQAALGGNSPAGGLSRAGQTARDAVRLYLNTADFEPLSDATLRARARRGLKGRKGAIAELDSREAGNAPSNATARPLIDTGQLRNAVSYVVR